MILQNLQPKPCLLILTLLTVMFFSRSTTAQTYLQTNNVEVFKDGQKMVAPWAGGMNSPQFCQVDLNNDQVEDLFVFDKVGGLRYCFLNDGFPDQVSYSYAPEYTRFFPLGNSWVIIEDLTCDGAPDFCTYNSSGSILVYSGFYENDTLKFELNQKRIDYSSSIGTIPLYASSIDRPAMVDINGDGDLDIISFTLEATRLLYYENQRIENNLDCDTLFFELKDRCWGNILETGLSVALTLGDTCSNKFLRLGDSDGERRRHGGSAIAVEDIDNDGSWELALGDITFTNLNLLKNNGQAENANFFAQDVDFPSSDVSVEVENFPSPFFLDLNNDGLLDLLAAPFSTSGTDNYNNVWYYENLGTANAPNFVLKKMNFLVDEMIDVGEGASPTFYDYNNDGKQDLIIGNVGYYNGLGVYQKSLTLYENTGSLERPTFTFITDDFLNLAADNLSSLSPEFGDIDGDGDLDLLIGDARGQVILKRNNGSNGAPNFGPIELLKDINDLNIDVGQNAVPELVDLNRDGKLDLVIGERGGNLSYYRGNGSLKFELITDSLGGITVRKGFSNVGFSSPAIADFDSDGKYDLLVSGYSGETYFYSNIEADLTADFTRSTATFLGESEGGQVALAIADLSNDGEPEIVAGIYNGGLKFYSNDPLLVGVRNNLIQSVNMDVELYPNPVKNKLNIQLNDFEVGEQYRMTVFDVMGKTIMSSKIGVALSKLNLNNLVKGTYLVEIYNAKKRYLGKVVVQ